MLGLRDFFHLPQVDQLIDQMIHEEAGALIVAGLDSRLASAETVPGGFLPSGRSAIFHILIDEILIANPSLRGVLITEDESGFKPARKLKGRLLNLPVQSSHSYKERLAEAVVRKPGILIIDRLNPQTVPAALEAAQKGIRVVSQLDTVFRGAGAARHLLDLGAAQTQLKNLSWILTVQRMAKLCPNCKHPSQPELKTLDRFAGKYPELTSGTFFKAGGCKQCGFTGRLGDVAVFDIFKADPEAEDYFDQPSLLPLESYMLHLASSGQLALEDIRNFEDDQLHRTFNTLVAREQALVEVNTALQRKLYELEAANRVLEQRTQALFSLQNIGQILITSSDLKELAERVCKRVRDLCGADRAILYYLHTLNQAELLAVSGWDLERVPAQLDAAREFSASLLSGAAPTPYNHWPPGIPPRHPDVEGARLRAGLLIPMVAQDTPVGVMMVHTTLKAGFTEGELALIQAFANQAALAIQRAGLEAELRSRITQLEAAQIELAKKERMERELELAHEVQQSVLPHKFPQIPGFQFAASNLPARQVGGDFYDVIPLDERRFGIAIADVSDKGMPAALYMALTRSLLVAEARRASSPGAVLANVNQLLLDIGEQNMFVTAFYGVVDRDSLAMTFARAGHEHPILVRNGEVQELGGQGIPLGIFGQDEFQLSEEQVKLSPGDRLVLYSDGMTDIMDAHEQLFGRERFLSLISAYAGLSPPDMSQAIFGDLARYQGSADQFDDMTLMIMQVES